MEFYETASLVGAKILLCTAWRSKYGTIILYDGLRFYLTQLYLKFILNNYTITCSCLLFLIKKNDDIMGSIYQLMTDTNFV